jgi:hypothetical protein
MTDMNTETPHPENPLTVFQVTIAGLDLHDVNDPPLYGLTLIELQEIKTHAV